MKKIFQHAMGCSNFVSSPTHWESSGTRYKMSRSGKRIISAKDVYRTGAKHKDFIPRLVNQVFATKSKVLEFFKFRLGF